MVARHERRDATCSIIEPDCHAADEPGARAHVELVVDPLQVELDRLGAEEEFGCRFSVRQPARYAVGDLEFAIGQRGRI